MAVQENPDVVPESRMAGAASASGAYIDGGRSVAAGRAWEWIVSGWRLFRRQAGIWILLVLVFGLIIIVVNFVPVVGQLALPLLMPVFVGGMMIGCQKIENDEELELAHLFAGFRSHLGPLILVALLGVLLMIAVIVPAMLLTSASALFAVLSGGSPEAAAAAGGGALLGLLIVFALVIPVNMALWFAPALIVLQNQSPTRAIVQSFKGCIRNMIPFLLYGVILFVLAIFASIPFGLGWLVLGPVVIASVYAAYRDIFLPG